MSGPMYESRSVNRVLFYLLLSFILVFIGCTQPTNKTTVNQPPVVNIISPSSGARFNINQPINFSCLAFDPEDGTLSGSSIIWSSSISGVIGTGNSLSLNSLPAGTHVITVRAMDSNGSVSTASVTITISSGPNPPIMNGPVTGSVGASITFTIGPFSTSINSITISWGDGYTVGPISVTGAPIRVSHAWLSPGTYTITAMVTDVWGSSTFIPIHTIVIYGTSSPTAPPVNGPTTGNTGVQHTFTIGPFSATTTSITINWGDGTVTGPISVTGGPIRISHTWSSPGNYTISLMVTDVLGSSSFIPVHNIIIYGSSTPVAPPMGGPTIGNVGVPYTFNIGPFSLTTDKFVEIDWGDGTIIGPVAITSSFLTFTHTWLTDQAIPYLIKARISDGMSSSAWTVVHTIKISKSPLLNPPPMSGPGKGKRFKQYRFTIGPFSTGTRTIEISWGDGTITGPVAVVPPIMTFSHVWTQRNLNGYMISVRVTDANGTSPFVNVFRIIIN